MKHITSFSYVKKEIIIFIFIWTKIAKAHPVAFGVSVAIHLLLLVALLWDQAAPEKKPIKKSIQ